MEYITTKEASKKWGISTIRITVLANEGRIPGAERLGRSWLIPANATKPPELKANHSRSAKKENTNIFSFPLYHFRPDWSIIRDAHLSTQQQILLQAETAVMECRFSDAYPLLEPILNAPDDIVTEIGALWNSAICCIALNKPDTFSKIYLRLQMLLSKDFPHRDDLVIILDILNTYVETLGSSSKIAPCNTDVHNQCLPLTCLLVGYAQLTKEVMSPGTADTILLELNLRFLETTSATIAVEMLHCHLLGIYYLRHNMEAVEKHSKAMVEIAYENKLYFPLVTYYRYFATVLSPILDQYPVEFRNHCYEIISKYDDNFTSFVASVSKNVIVSKLTNADYPYIYFVLTGESNSSIAEELGVSQHTVNRRLEKICEKFDVNNKKELREYLRNYM